MHCSACTMLISDTLKEQGMRDVQVSLSDETVTLVSDSNEDAASLASRLTALVQEHGYAFTTARPVKASTTREWLISIPLVVVIVILLLSLDRFGLTSLLSGREASIGTALLVGIVASVSTCLAIVGGLLLSLSATYAQAGTGVRPHILFHVGRFGGFIVLGGLLGVVGSAVRIGVYGSTILGVVVSVVMLLLGIHLLELTPRVRAVTLSRGLFDRAIARAGSAGSFAPLVLGIATFFLPCGFTQSMQVVALSSGNAVTGALTMGAFALGTFPVLALLSFGSLDLAKSRFRGIFFKTAGLLVILFALYNIYNALGIFGIIM
jgi:sulfite exporter TauE/SafE